MSENQKQAPKAGAAKGSEKAPSLYKELEAMSDAALSTGDLACHAALHSVVVALAGAKFAASQAEHVGKPSEEALVLLERVKAL
ncbi:hypothetical protein LFL96_21165 [Paraburkholderia sp. D15]|uniref:hypothetical protein n=1 Tax=Paraburkholderia sp. D15 TaxID=2880218 RepID=UPI00247A0D80|nr:hypothetical protein [Paraburkholderia sp. D15]WGS53570.1 hypothetical protein LFL96_21165 [Paraburkholderia sp. D15]